MRKLLVLITFLLAACASAPDLFEREADAYAAYLADEVNAGRMTDPQAQYLMAQKVNQLLSQKYGDKAQANAATLNALQIMNQMQSQPRSQELNCNTYQRGASGTVRCY